MPERMPAIGFLISCASVAAIRLVYSIFRVIIHVFEQPLKGNRQLSDLVVAADRLKPVFLITALVSSISLQVWLILRMGRVILWEMKMLAWQMRISDAMAPTTR